MKAMKKLEIPGISQYEKNINTVNEVKIIVLSVNNILFKRFGIKYKVEKRWSVFTEDYESLYKAKKSSSCIDGRFKHVYICPSCGTKNTLSKYNNNYADYFCKVCGNTFTRFGEKSKKLI